MYIERTDCTQTSIAHQCPNLIYTVRTPKDNTERLPIEQVTQNSRSIDWYLLDQVSIHLNPKPLGRPSCPQKTVLMWYVTNFLPKILLTHTTGILTVVSLYPLPVMRAFSSEACKEQECLHANQKCKQPQQKV